MPSEIVPVTAQENQEVARTRTLVRSREVTLGDLRFASDTDLIRVATEKANAVSEIVEQQKLYDVIDGRKRVNIVGWLTLLGFVGLAVREAEIRQEPDGKTWSAWVELTSRSTGEVVGRASSSCSSDEPRQKGKLSFMVRSMAVARATVRVCQQQLAWVMALKGYAVTDEGGDDQGDGSAGSTQTFAMTEKQAKDIVDAFAALPFPVSRARLEKWAQRPIEQLPESMVAELKRAYAKLRAIKDHDPFWEAAEKYLPEMPF